MKRFESDKGTHFIYATIGSLVPLLLLSITSFLWFPQLIAMTIASIVLGGSFITFAAFEYWQHKTDRGQMDGKDINYGFIGVLCTCTAFIIGAKLF